MDVYGLTPPPSSTSNNDDKKMNPLCCTGATKMSSHSVWHSKTTSGFVHNVLVAYHATRPESVENILKIGFR